MKGRLIVYAFAGLLHHVTSSAVVTAYCNPHTLEHECSCTEDWWEPILEECTPCKIICYTIHHEMCQKFCPAYSAEEEQQQPDLMQPQQPDLMQPQQPDPMQLQTTQANDTNDGTNVICINSTALILTFVILLTIVLSLFICVVICWQRQQSQDAIFLPAKQRHSEKSAESETLRHYAERSSVTPKGMLMQNVEAYELA
ncbi:hypothetical protein CAPTEDRAFT_214968 [Capitella teleta]|uniref:TNFR-Cys domain-containing protein n=1 Tax=Capitella teleta TaxID=283909 RepID=R7TFJ3_CAPTE|nr:hypothetical protein CAPTEDRAFT_214968 [Capitella teleta]|eukprot:ELT89801.1 hypothetical protein CAPTEDRAFT_214968 [Capitella teleta]